MSTLSFEDRTMKVLVPIDVESNDDVEAAVREILSGAWPADVEFHLLNVIEADTSGRPCARCNGGPCHCVEHRVTVLADVMRRLEREMPGVPFYLVIEKGRINERIAAMADELDAERVLVRPSRTNPTAHRFNIPSRVKAAFAAIALSLTLVQPSLAWIPPIPVAPIAPHRLGASVHKNVVPANPSENELRMELLLRLGDEHLDGGNYETAITYYEQALAYMRELDPPKSRLSVLTGGLSIGYCAVRKFALAQKYGRMSLEAALEAHPRDLIDISIAYNNLAYIYKVSGKPNLAETNYEQAVLYSPLSTRDDRVRAATIESNLADVYAANKKTARALSAYRHALQVFVQELTRQHPAVQELEEKISLLKKKQKVFAPEAPARIVMLPAAFDGN
jgi:tetratricopeptide (TPR) repeat protein